MKKVQLSKFLIIHLSRASSYLTKMEMLLIFALSITSAYAVKMEMLLAESKPMNSTATLIAKAVMPPTPNSGIVKQSTMMFEKDLTDLEDRNSHDFITRGEITDKSDEEEIKIRQDKDHIFYNNVNITQKDMQVDMGQLLTSSGSRPDKFTAWLYGY